MSCALCLEQDVPLCDSHILPEFLYKEVYEGDGQIYYAFSNDPGQRAKRRRKGFYENLLCRDCESIIQRYEDYSAKVIYGGTQIAVQQSPQMITISELNYPKFKLFQVSLIWRAGVSKSAEFEDVNLGPHSEPMRRMLLEGDPGEAHEYPCVLSFLPPVHNLMRKMIYVPERVPEKILGHTCYRAILAGMHWVFFISDQLRDFPHPEAFLSKDGTLRVFRAGAPAMDFFLQVGKEFAKANPKFIK